MSNWKDTVMDRTGLPAFCGSNTTKFVLEAQAEISFKAGYKQRKDEELPYYNEEREIGRKAGIREVVEQANGLANCGKELAIVIDDKNYDVDSFTTQPMKNALYKWQAKLKEWRLE